MSIYLPIAEMNTNIYLIVDIGKIVGALADKFGVGGGLLVIAVVMFVGIPPVVEGEYASRHLVA